MNDELREEFLHSMFRMKSILASEFGKGNVRDLTMPEYVLLKGVQEQVPLSQIREYLAISQSAVSQIVSSLEKKGCLIRGLDQSDRRSLVLTLTPEGLEAFREKDAVIEARFGKLVSTMSEEEIQKIISLLSRLGDSVSRIRENVREVRKKPSGEVLWNDC